MQMDHHTGLHTALGGPMAGQGRKGKRTDAMVQYADVLPLFYPLPGAKEGLGRNSFDAVLTGKDQAPKIYLRCTTTSGRPALPDPDAFTGHTAIP